MSVAWCPGINTNSEDRLKHRKGGYLQYNVSTAKKCHIFFSTFVSCDEQNEVIFFLF